MTGGGVNPKELLEAATPRPWYFERGDGLISARIGAEGHRRGVGDYCTGYFDSDPRPERGDADADAALIVRAVNDYEALLDVASAFGALYQPFMDEQPDDRPVWAMNGAVITVGHLRAAARLTEGSKAP